MNAAPGRAQNTACYIFFWCGMVLTRPSRHVKPTWAGLARVHPVFRYYLQARSSQGVKLLKAVARAAQRMAAMAAIHLHAYGNASSTMCTPRDLAQKVVDYL